MKTNHTEPVSFKMFHVFVRFFIQVIGAINQTPEMFNKDQNALHLLFGGFLAVYCSYERNSEANLSVVLSLSFHFTMAANGRPFSFLA